MTEFLDLPAKAKELGISDSLLRARILSNEVLCFFYLASSTVSGTHEGWLPPWTDSDFPSTRWVDHGSEWDNRNSFNRDPPQPRYTVKGWIALSTSAAESILTKGKVKLDGMQAWVVDATRKTGWPIFVQAKADEEWVESDYQGDGGYYRQVPIFLTRNDLYIESESDAGKGEASPRRQASLLRIIAAMLDLLQAKDGGNFPSQSKVIDQLIERYGNAEGLSKRTLETVFPEAVQVAGKELRPKS